MEIIYNNTSNNNRPNQKCIKLIGFKENIQQQQDLAV